MSINPRGVGFTGDDVIMLFGEYFEYLLCDHPVAGCRRELSGIACPAQPFLEWNHGVEACELVVDEILLCLTQCDSVAPDLREQDAARPVDRPRRLPHTVQVHGSRRRYQHNQCRGIYRSSDQVGLRRGSVDDHPCRFVLGRLTNSETVRDFDFEWQRRARLPSMFCS